MSQWRAVCILWPGRTAQRNSGQYLSTVALSQGWCGRGRRWRAMALATGGSLCHRRRADGGCPPWPDGKPGHTHGCPPGRCSAYRARHSCPGTRHRLLSHHCRAHVLSHGARTRHAAWPWHGPGSLHTHREFLVPGRQAGMCWTPRGWDALFPLRASALHRSWHGRSYAFVSGSTTLLCPASHRLSPQERRPERDGSSRVLDAARMGKCRTCL